MVAAARQKLELRRFPKLDLRGKIPEGEGDGFSEIPVGRVADQAGAGIGNGAEDHDMKDGILKSVRPAGKKNACAILPSGYFPYPKRPFFFI